MPYPAVDNVTQLSALLVDTFDDYSQQLAQYLSKEHNPDGTHGNVTADSIVVSGAFTVDGVATFDSIVTETLDAHTITARIVTVQGVQLALTNSASMVIYNGDGSASSQIVLNIPTSFNEIEIGNVSAPTTLNIYGDTNTHASGASSGSVNVNAGKFTVDGATGNTAIAGDLSATGAAFSGDMHVAAGQLMFWTSRAVMQSPSDARIELTDNAQSAGVTLRFNTDALLEVRNRADSAYATIAAFSYSVGTTPGDSNSFQFVDTGLNTRTLTVEGGIVTVYG